ncbi:MAG TPA: hypothetical protein PLC65_03830, partial [Bacteroidia bacterium]|nr:hypothetical protein [Bacteroidia bacterium]
MMLRRLAYLFFIVFGISFSLNATHNRAGEITYKWLFGYTYEITLVTYTDDGPSIADRCKLTIHFGDGDSIQAIRINGALDPTNDCPGSKLGEIISPGFKKNIYKATHTY